MIDLQGTEIEVGSKVAYFQGGRYDSLNIGTVLDIKKKVKVSIEKSSRGSYGPNEEVWTDRDRVIVLFEPEQIWEDGYCQHQEDHDCVFGSDMTDNPYRKD